MTVAFGSTFSGYLANSVIQNSQQSAFKKNTRLMHPKFGDAACCGGTDSSNVNGESGMSFDDAHENTTSLSGKMKDVEELRKKQNPDYLSTLLSKVWPGKVLPGKTGLKKAGLELSIGVATFTFALLAQKAVQHYWIDRESRQAIRQAEKLLRQEERIKRDFRRANWKEDTSLDVFKLFLATTAVEFSKTGLGLVKWAITHEHEPLPKPQKKGDCCG